MNFYIWQFEPSSFVFLKINNLQDYLGCTYFEFLHEFQNKIASVC